MAILLTCFRGNLDDEFFTKLKVGPILVARTLIAMLSLRQGQTLRKGKERRRLEFSSKDGRSSSKLDLDRLPTKHAPNEVEASVNSVKFTFYNQQTINKPGWRPEIRFHKRLGEEVQEEKIPILGIDSVSRHIRSCGLARKFGGRSFEVEVGIWPRLVVRRLEII